MPKTGRPKGEATRQIKITISEKRAQQFEAAKPSNVSLSAYCGIKLDPPRVTSQRTEMDPSDCRHPVNRRIGKACMECGKEKI